MKNSPKKKITYKDKHKEFFFENHNNLYNTKSNINSVLPYKILNYYVSDEENSKLKQNNKIKS